jgi:hypothetical protein
MGRQIQRLGSTSTVTGEHKPKPPILNNDLRVLIRIWSGAKDEKHDERTLNNCVETEEPVICLDKQAGGDRWGEFRRLGCGCYF